MPETYNHFGTAYVGRRDVRADGSYITTEFYVFFDLPIFPLRSYRVWPTGPRVVRRKFWSDFEMQSYRVESLPLNLRQVGNVYLGSLAILFAILLALLCIGALYALVADENTTRIGNIAAVGIIVCFAVMVVGIIYLIIRGRRSEARRR